MSRFGKQQLSLVKPLSKKLIRPKNKKIASDCWRMYFWGEVGEI